MSRDLRRPPRDTPCIAISLDEVTRGSMPPNPEPGATARRRPCIHAANLAAGTSRARRLGAKVVQEQSQVPGMGASIIVTAPVGVPHS